MLDMGVEPPKPLLPVHLYSCIVENWLKGNVTLLIICNKKQSIVEKAKVNISADFIIIHKSQLKYKNSDTFSLCNIQLNSTQYPMIRISCHLVGELSQNQDDTPTSYNGYLQIIVKLNS